MALIVRTNQPPQIAFQPAMAPAVQFLQVDGTALVLPSKCTLPRICLRTGSTEDLVEMRRSLYWHHPGYYFFILLSLLVYLIVALIVRQRAVLTFYVTRTERTRRRQWIALNTVIFLMTFGCLAIAGTTGVSFFFILSPICFIASVVIYILKARWIYPIKIESGVATIKGIPPAVLQQLAAQAVAVT
jgi:hypothetical protein